MIQFQTAPATPKSDSIRELIELDRAEERSRFEALRNSRETERKKLEWEIEAEDHSAKSSRNLAHIGTLHGISTAVFGITAFSLRGSIVDSGHMAFGVIATIAGSVSLALSLPLIFGSVIGWTETARSVKRVRELKRRLKETSK